MPPYKISKIITISKGKQRGRPEEETQMMKLQGVKRKWREHGGRGGLPLTTLTLTMRPFGHTFFEVVSRGVPRSTKRQKKAPAGKTPALHPSSLHRFPVALGRCLLHRMCVKQRGVRLDFREHAHSSERLFFLLPIFPPVSFPLFFFFPLTQFLSL